MAFPTITDQAQVGVLGPMHTNDTVAVPTQRQILIELQVISHILHHAVMPDEDLGQLRNNILEGLLSYAVNSSLS